MSVRDLRVRAPGHSFGNMRVLTPGKLHLVVGRAFTEKRLQSLLDHEIGTHFIRALNHHLRRLPGPVSVGVGMRGRGLAIRC